MQKGDTKTIILDPKDAFGPYIDDLIVEVPKDMFRSNVELDINSNIKINAPSGKTYYGTVTKMSENSYTIDLNHPLAGKKITVTMGIVSINEEQLSGEKKSRFQFKLTKKGKTKKSSSSPLKTKSDPSNTG
jgi:peptidylprolyl isomerase